LLDDFSLGDDDEEDMGQTQTPNPGLLDEDPLNNEMAGSSSSRTSSVDSVQSINLIRRNKGKQIWSTLSH